MNRTIYTQAAEDIWPVDSVVLYDDADSSYAAKALLDQVAANAGADIQFSQAFWRIDCLLSPTANVGVFRDLPRSTIIVLALRARRDLPNSVLTCVECWAHGRSGKDSALVVLGNAGPAAVEKLREMAERHGITLFCEQTIPPGLGWHPNIEGLEKREQFPGAILGHIPDCSRPGNYRDWGLNE